MKTEKTKSEILWSYNSFTLHYNEGVIDIVVRITNPYCKLGSLGQFKFKSPSTSEWLPATQYIPQYEDLMNIPLNGRNREVSIRWDAAKDLRIMQTFTGVSLLLTFYDRSNLGGVETDALESSVNVDFTVGNVKEIIHPNFNDPYMDFLFINPTTVRPSKMHMKLEVDDVNTFDSPNLMIFDTELDRNGWSVDGGSFPATGVDGQVKNKISLTRAELSSLVTGDYYYRITPRVDQFYAVIDSPYDGQVFIGTNVDISGTVTVLD